VRTEDETNAILDTIGLSPTVRRMLDQIRTELESAYQEHVETLTAERDALRERVRELETRQGLRIRAGTRRVNRVRAVSVGSSG